MVDPALQAAMAVFDDGALAALANVGLVRRARRDVEEGKVALLSVEGTTAVVAADGHDVAIDQRGPRAASCACKAATVCRHRIAAVLLLQGLEPTTGASADTADLMPPDSDADPRQIIEAIPLATIEKWAGKAALRAAIDLIERAGDLSITSNAIAVTIDGLDEPVRILRGQGPDGIVSKAAKGLQKAYHAAAVLAAHRHFGSELPLAASEQSAAVEAKPLSIDVTFLAQVAAALRDCVALGFNLAPLSLEESLFMLSVSSRADHLPRLAAMLRAIAAQLRLRRQRALAFDPDRQLELLAHARRLVDLLGRDERDAARLPTLIGTLRRDYVPSEPLQLIGCGGERWRTAAGARGVTAWFYDAEAARFLSVSNARGPGQDPNFSLVDAWETLSHWQSRPLKTLAHARITLSSAGVTEDGRLSSPAAARAIIAEENVQPQSDWSIAIDAWQQLQARFIAQSGFGLDSNSAAQVFLIAPHAQAAPYFDDLAQQLVWPLRDHSGTWLGLTLDHQEHGSPAIEALEAALRGGWQGSALVRVARQGDGLAVTPMVLFGGTEPIDLSFGPRRQPTYSAAHTAAPPLRSGVSQWIDRLRNRQGTAFVRTPPGIAAAAIVATWRLLLDYVDVGPAMGASFVDLFAAQAARLEAVGLPTVAALLRSVADADSLLTASYAVTLARQQQSSLPLLRAGT